MITAFQSNAFQNNAFQIGSVPPVPVVTGGHFLPIYEHKKRKHALGNIQLVYDKAKELPRKQTKALRDSIREFIPQADSIQAKLPEIIKVDYEALALNELAYKQFLAALDNIHNQIVIMEEKQKQDDELLLMTIISCLIH